MKNIFVIAHVSDHTFIGVHGGIVEDVADAAEFSSRAEAEEVRKVYERCVDWSVQALFDETPRQTIMPHDWHLSYRYDY